MIDDCRPHLEHFNSHFIYESHDTVNVSETHPEGAGTVTFSIAAPAIVLKSRVQAPLLWALQVRNCANGAFITFSDSSNNLHIVELKLVMTSSTWAHAAKQFHGMFLTALASSRILNIPKFGTVTCYVALSEDRVTQTVEQDLILLKTEVGGSRSFGRQEEWDRGFIRLPFGVEANLVKIFRDSSGNASYGPVA